MPLDARQKRKHRRMTAHVIQVVLRLVMLLVQQT